MDPRTRPTRIGVTCRVLTAVFTLAAASLLWVAPAAAHTELSSSEPSADDTVTEPVHTVVLVFSQAVSPELAEVRVTDPDGNRLDDGAPMMEDERVEQALLGPEQIGEHTVEWRVIALDGHPVEGTFTFVYDGEQAAEEAEPQAEPDEPDAAATPTDPADGSAGEGHAPSEEHTTEPDDPEEHGDEDAADMDDREEQAVAPPADDGARTSSANWPLGIAAIVIALTAGAAVHAVRTVRSWPVGVDAPAG